jgi:hypothetical protein
MGKAPHEIAKLLTDRYGTAASARAGEELLAASAEHHQEAILLWTAVIQEMGRAFGSIHAPEMRHVPPAPELDPLSPQRIASMLRARYGQAASSIAARRARDLRAEDAEDEAATWEQAQRLLENGGAQGDLFSATETLTSVGRGRP